MEQAPSMKRIKATPSTVMSSLSRKSDQSVSELLSEVSNHEVINLFKSEILKRKITLKPNFFKKTSEEGLIYLFYCCIIINIFKRNN